MMASILPMHDVVLDIKFMKRRQFTNLSLFLLGLTLANCGQRQDSPTSLTSSGGDSVRIWWSQGYYPEETEAIQRLVQQWENDSGLPVELTLYSEGDILQEAERAISAGNPPDVLYSHDADLTFIPKLAWNNQLADVSSVIEAAESLYSPAVLNAVKYLNKTTGERSYYSAPITQMTNHIHYWQPLLSSFGQGEEAIPEGWDQFWAFWEQAQAPIRNQGRSKFYSMGLPMSASASDTFFVFEQFLAAFDVELVNSTGDLEVDKAQVREGIAQALSAYTRFYKQQYVPPEATKWGNADNNVTFLSRSTLMTINPTLSIPGSQRQDQSTYEQQLVTTPWPNKPNGDPMTSMVSIKQVVIFESSKYKDEAKKLLSYLIEPDNLKLYIQGSQGRFFPVMPQLLEDPFWQDSNDPHISTASKQFYRTRPFAQALNPAYSEVQSQNIWGTVIAEMVTKDLSAQAATDRAIAAIKTIFQDWQ